MNELINESDIILNELKKVFPPEKISWRVGNTNAKKLNCKPWEATKGSALAYIDARDVMERLDDVVGVDKWQCKYPYPGCCELSIKFGEEWITKSNAAGETQVEAEKGQASDAFKRAAVLFGIGRYLYDLPLIWVDLDPKKGTISEYEKNKLPKRLAEWQCKREEKLAQKMLIKWMEAKKD